MTGTIHNIDAVGYNKAGKRVDCRTHQTHVLNSDNRHWCVAQRMAKTVGDNKKVKTVRLFLDGVEYALSKDYQMEPTGKVLRDYDQA